MAVSQGFSLSKLIKIPTNRRNRAESLFFRRVFILVLNIHLQVIELYVG